MEERVIKKGADRGIAVRLKPPMSGLQIIETIRDDSDEA
jgi:hypothetical protein